MDTLTNMDTHLKQIMCRAIFDCCWWRHAVCPGS